MISESESQNENGEELVQGFCRFVDRMVGGMEMRSERFFTREKASLEIYGRAGTIIAHVKNLSMGGACLEWTQEDVGIQKGDLVRMTVFLKALNRRHNLSAQVVWRVGKQTGISFIRPDQVLEKMVEKT